MIAWKFAGRAVVVVALAMVMLLGGSVMPLALAGHDRVVMPTVDLTEPGM